MGIHTWFGYVDYELQCLDSFINLFENFCQFCHTDEDWGYDGCRACPIGNCLVKFRDYLADSCVEDISETKKTKNKIKKFFQHIELRPFFGNTKMIENIKRIKKYRNELQKGKEEFDRKIDEMIRKDDKKQKVRGRRTSKKKFKVQDRYR
jgi:hypothetical protein